MGEKIGRCIVIGGGEICDYKAVAGLFRADDFILCADSGYDHCIHLGCTPQLLVGDFDSVRSALPANIPQLALPPDKDYTDTTLAVEEAVARGATSLVLTGMLGGRLDHSLANMQTLASCVQRGIQAVITDGITTINAVCALDKPASITLPPRAGYYFSLLAWGAPCRGVTIEGGKYPLTDYPLRADEPRAVSNEYLDTPVRISLERGTVLIVSLPMSTAPNKYA